MLAGTEVNIQIRMRKKEKKRETSKLIKQIAEGSPDDAQIPRLL